MEAMEHIAEVSTLAEPEHCTYEHCVGEYSHVLTPYLPPQLELPTSVVRIRARVAPPLTRSQITTIRRILD